MIYFQFCFSVKHKIMFKCKEIDPIDSYPLEMVSYYLTGT